MFNCKPWAAAFVNSLGKGDNETEDGLNTLNALASWTSSLPHAVFGRSAAEKLEPLIREAISGAGRISSGQETAIRFFLLAAKKNKALYINSIISEIIKILNKKRGVVIASVEYAYKPEEGFANLITETIKKRTGASRVELTGQVKEELIGGYRLRIGDEIIDASIRSQLQKMEACLAGGGNQW
jgi:F-type H+-transporting ATPase subunit delta